MTKVVIFRHPAKRVNNLMYILIAYFLGILCKKVAVQKKTYYLLRNQINSSVLKEISNIITLINSHYVNRTHTVNSDNVTAHCGHDFEGFHPHKQL